MTDNKKSPGTNRKDRLKSNLRANLQKRKSQTRARSSDPAPTSERQEADENNKTPTTGSTAETTDKH